MYVPRATEGSEVLDAWQEESLSFDGSKWTWEKGQKEERENITIRKSKSREKARAYRCFQTLYPFIWSSRNMIFILNYISYIWHKFYFTCAKRSISKLSLISRTCIINCDKNSRRDILEVRVPVFSKSLPMHWSDQMEKI